MICGGVVIPIRARRGKQCHCFRILNLLKAQGHQFGYQNAGNGFFGANQVAIGGRRLYGHRADWGPAASARRRVDTSTCWEQDRGT